MKLRTNILLIFCTFILPTAFTLVITQYDQHTMTAYYQQTSIYAAGRTVNEFSTIQNFSPFCEQIRRARVYIRRSVGNNIKEYAKSTNESSTHQHRISKQDLHRENTQTLEIINFHVNTLKEQQSLPAFSCLNLDGIMRWLVTPSFLPNSAFLFTIDNVFKHLQSREIRGRNVSNATLKAVIDLSASYSSRSYNESLIQKTLLEYAQSTNSSDEELLCGLHPIIRYRVCAIIADKIQLLPLRNFNRTSSFESYLNPEIVVYHQPKNSTGNCPSIKITKLGITKKMLRCSVRNLNSRSNYKFFLSKNTRTTETLFYITFSGSVSDDLPMIFDEFNVPLFEYLHKYKEALQHVDV